MFSDNGKISERQLYRMIIVAMLGPALLICPRLLGEYGSLGIVAYLVVGLMSALYIIVNFKLKSLVNDKPVWNIAKGFFGTIAVIRLFVVAIGGLYIMVDVVRKGIESYFPMIENAQKTVIKFYTIEESAKQVYNFYKEICQK